MLSLNATWHLDGHIIFWGKSKLHSTRIEPETSYQQISTYTIVSKVGLSLKDPPYIYLNINRVEYWGKGSRASPSPGHCAHKD